MEGAGTVDNLPLLLTSDYLTFVSKIYRYLYTLYCGYLDAVPCCGNVCFAYYFILLASLLFLGSFFCALNFAYLSKAIARCTYGVPVRIFDLMHNL